MTGVTALWEQIKASPDFPEQACRVLNWIIADTADHADDREAYLAFVDEVLTRYTFTHVVGFDLEDDGLVRVSWPGINSTLVTVASFLPGAEVVAMSHIDLDEAPEGVGECP